MNIPTNFLFAIALLLLALERLIPTTIPPWIVGVLLLIVALAMLL